MNSWLLKINGVDKKVINQGDFINFVNGTGTSMSWDGLNVKVNSIPGSGGIGTVTSVACGQGMNFATITTSGTVIMGAPSTCTAATPNSAVGTSHTHTVSGFVLTADAYDSWNLKLGGVLQDVIINDFNLNVIQGDRITLGYAAQALTITADVQAGTLYYAKALNPMYLDSVTFELKFDGTHFEMDATHNYELEIHSTLKSNWDTAYGWGNWASGVNKAFVDALNVDADTLDGHDTSYFAAETALIDIGGVPVNDEIAIWSGAQGLNSHTSCTINSSGTLDCLVIQQNGVRLDTMFASGVSGAANRVAVLTNNSTITGQPNLLFDGSTLTVTGTCAASTVTGINVTSGANPGHTHTTAAITDFDPANYLLDTTDTLTGNLTVTGDLILQGGTLDDVRYIRAYDTNGIQFKRSDGVEYWRMENDGDFHAENDIIAYSTTVSDIRLKENIKPIVSALNKIIQLDGIEFNYINKSGKHIGIIAQEIEKIIPEVVVEKRLPLIMDDGKKYKVVRYQELIPYLVECIKELSEEVNELKK